MLRHGKKVIAAVVAGLAVSSQAGLVIDFRLAGGGTSVDVPLGGGVYTVEIFARSNPSIANLGFTSGYLGALSANTGTVLDADITASSLGASWVGSGQVGALSDLNADGRIDLGKANGTAAKTDTAWMRPFAGATAVNFNASEGVFATFTVTIPAYAPGAASVVFAPQVDPTGLGNDWGWADNGVAQTGSAPTAVGTGTSVTFNAVPEPASLSLLGLGALGLVARRRRA